MAKRELVGTPTKEKTKAGRTVYRTKKGERVSEKSATVGPINGIAPDIRISSHICIGLYHQNQTFSLNLRSPNLTTLQIFDLV